MEKDCKEMVRKGGEGGLQQIIDYFPLTFDDSVDHFFSFKNELPDSVLATLPEPSPPPGRCNRVVRIRDKATIPTIGSRTRDVRVVQESLANIHLGTGNEEAATAAQK